MICIGKLFYTILFLFSYENVQKMLEENVGDEKIVIIKDAAMGIVNHEQYLPKVYINMTSLSHFLCKCINYNVALLGPYKRTFCMSFHAK